MGREIKFYLDQVLKYYQVSVKLVRTYGREFKPALRFCFSSGRRNDTWSRIKPAGTKLASKIFYLILNQQIEFCACCCYVLRAAFRVHKKVFVYHEVVAYEIAKDGKNCEVVSGARLILYHKSIFVSKFNYVLVCEWVYKRVRNYINVDNCLKFLNHGNRKKIILSFNLSLSFVIDTYILSYILCIC